MREEKTKAIPFKIQDRAETFSPGSTVAAGGRRDRESERCFRTHAQARSNPTVPVVMLSDYHPVSPGVT